MFAAVGQGNAFRDGVFSHLNSAAGNQAYEASVSQFQEGSLGATIRTGRQPAQLRRRAMRGFGHSYRDGSLGDGSTSILIGPDGASIGPTPVAAVPYYKRPEVLACAAIAVVAAYFLYKKK